VLGTRAADLGFEVERIRVDRHGDAFIEPESFDALVVMGSIESANNAELEWITRERGFVAAAVDADIPVLGVCFGGQLLAQVLGGSVIPSPSPEVGWLRIQTDRPSVVSAGPWLLWHEEAVVPPPGSRVVARTDVAIQAYLKEQHTGVQFHPEVTPDLVNAWLHEAHQRGEVTPAQHQALWDDVDNLALTSANNAGSLFDGFLHRAGLLDGSATED
jgi:GMP synthase-like glutamine amidotransferase